MSDFDRRDFLKLIGAGAGAAAAAGCSDPVEKLIPWVVQPEEITPGLPVVYASTCMECEAACGLHVRTREARPIKLEGNPEHPINRGALCARGQAGIFRTFHPDRFRAPLERRGGKLEPITWEQAATRLGEKLKTAAGRTAVFGSPTGPTLSGLIERWLEAVGGGTRVDYEPFTYEALREAAKAVYGVDSRPIFDLTDTDLVIDFGADALGTGISPVEHARQLMAARDASREAGRNARLVYVGPRLDETASMADEWLPAKPGSEGLVALAVARVTFEERRAAGRPVGGDPELLASVLSDFDANEVAASAGIPADAIRRLGKAVAAAERPAALPPGVALTSRRATAASAAVLVLNAVADGLGRTVRIPAPGSASGGASSFRDVVKLIDAMKSGDVSVLLVHGANPLYSLPPDAGFAEALEKVDYVVSFASMPDETATRADLVLPDHTPLESWGDAAPRPGIRSLVQPTIRPLYDTQALGDTLLATARAMGATAGLPEGSFRVLLEQAWADTDWRAALARGGVFGAMESVADVSVAPSVARLQFKEPQLEGDGAFVLLPVPSPLLGDGRGANLPWLQEIPDPITKIAWQSWAEVSRNTADALGVGPGDVLSIETTYGAVEVPVWPRGGIRDDVVAVAIGQGHTVGLYASLANDGSPDVARGVNVISILPALTDETGGRAWLAARAKVSSAGRYQRLPFTQGTDNKRERLLGERISLVALAKGENPFAANEDVTWGVGPSGQGKKRTVDDAQAAGGPEGADSEHAAASEHHEGPHQIRRAYDPRDDAVEGDPYRWGMTIDVDKCTGCSACVVACYVENNVAVVGEEGVMRSRQMSWLRIERLAGDGYQQLEGGRPGPQNHEELGNTDIRNSPMLCQQCGAAPCEPVCPVFATYHTPSGLNAMIYNRCIGTRYCSNNCPYKVRRFNWFDYQIEGWPEPWPLMLNPDVTVRGQGVMEKCTFCIQRIQAGRLEAKGRGETMVPDGSVKTACQQTCPTQAISFGNLRDDGSEVVAVAKQNEGRAYRALHVLNTRPAITYLAKVAREEEGHGGHHG
jgi:anaerobic selenocysteine-containing dehydrogenase/Fe-S-cluster-containing dehydrogenase component